jgi:hypothetical protein
MTPKKFCPACRGALSETIASICGEVFGDEYMERYLRCASCGRISREVYCDRFSGEDHVTLEGPLDEANAMARIALIRRCPNPADEDCDCDAHREYFRVGRPG